MNLQGNIAVQNASKAHKLKVKVRKICQQMDELKTSKVKIDVFFSVLKITNIKLNKDVENELIGKFEYGIFAFLNLFFECFKKICTIHWYYMKFSCKINSLKKNTQFKEWLTIKKH